MCIIMDELSAAIKAENAVLVKQLLQTIQQQILQGDMELMTAVVDPASITELHALLVDHLQVNPRLMMLRHRVTNRKRRAFLFVQAMLNGVTYQHPEKRDD